MNHTVIGILQVNEHTVDNPAHAYKHTHKHNS